jgi:hypothetical protein
MKHGFKSEMDGGARFERSLIAVDSAVKGPGRADYGRWRGDWDRALDEAVLDPDVATLSNRCGPGGVLPGFTWPAPSNRSSSL